MHYFLEHDRLELTLIGQGFELLCSQFGLVSGDSEGSLSVRGREVDLAALCHYSVVT